MDVEIDDEHRLRICRSRDPRFDGWFVMAVTSTGIYCRPSCPARPARRDHLRFFATSAAAARAGFRACRRCRPDAAPGSPEWSVRSDVVGRAMRLIGDGVVDRVGVSGLAAQLGYSTRQLNRIVSAELGVGVASLAQVQRAHTARVLIETTTLPFVDVAFAAGFGSVRQFNDVVRQVFGTSPTVLRSSRRNDLEASPGSIRLRLPARSPYDAPSMWSFLRARAIEGVEWMDGEAYCRRLRLAGGAASVSLMPGDGAVTAELHLDRLHDLSSAVQRCRRLLDLDADPIAIDEALDGLGPSGARVPGAVDGWEIAARAVVGQQVSVAAARTVLARICAASPTPDQFPAAEWVGSISPDALPLPRARAATLVRVAAAVVEGRLDLSAGADRQRFDGEFQRIEGIGPWTSGYVRMRALGDPDVLLAGDLVVKRTLAGRDPTAWAPWRSYATVRLWSSASVPHPPSRNG